MRKPLALFRRRANGSRPRSPSQSLTCSTHARLLRFETFENRRMLSADLVSKAAFPSFSAGGGPSSVVSANGRYVAFADAAALTSLSTTPGIQNIYRFDRVTGDVVLVSVNVAGAGSGNRDSVNPVISADGNVIVFSSTASNLNPLDMNTTSDVFARNLSTGTTYLVSVNSVGTGSGNGTSDSPVISADGNVVAFHSTASNLNPLDTSTGSDIYARNLSAGTTYLVSINSTDTGGGIGDSDTPVISTDGNVVAFRSQARNLSPLKTSLAYYDIFARNLATSTTRLVSINSAATSSGNANSDSAVISADGSVVAFRSDASNLVFGDSNDYSDVFSRNLLTGTTRLVSINSAGTGSGNGTSDSPAMSADGSVVAFRSGATDIYALNGVNKYNIFARNVVTATTQLVSVGSNGVESGAGDGPAISADGSVVVFSSDANNLHPLDTNVYLDVFARNLVTGTISLVSVNSAGTAGGNLWSDKYRGSSPGISAYLGISADGGVVSFSSDASDLVPGDFDGKVDLFVRDLSDGSTQLVSKFDLATPSTTGGGSSTIDQNAVSADGRYVVFVSAAQNLVAGLDIPPEVQNVYRLDRVTGHIDLVSINVNGTGCGNNDSDMPVICADGSVVAFTSEATNLDSSAATGATQIFVRNYTTGTTTLVSVNMAGTKGGNRSSYEPIISADGTVVAFYSLANDLQPLATNGVAQIVARNLTAGTTYLVSISSDGTASGNGTSDKPVISADGRVVAFESEAWNLHPAKTVGNGWEVYARDLQAGNTYLVSSGTLGHYALNPVISANGSVVAYNLLDGGVYARNIVTGTDYAVSIDPTGTFVTSGIEQVISADGSVVAFRSTPPIPLGTGAFSIYAHNLLTNTTALVSVNSAGASANGYCANPSISADGNIIAFHSQATNLSSLKTNGNYDDVFARDLFTGTTYLLSSNVDGGSSGNEDSAYGLVVSADGRVVVFSSDASNLVQGDTNSSTDVFAATIPNVSRQLGDFNQNGVVDAADYVLWRRQLGTTGVTPYSGADGSGNGSVGPEDYGVWREHFGQTSPSPAAGSSLGSATASAGSVAPIDESTGVATSMSLYFDERDQTVEMPRTGSERQSGDQSQGLSPAVAPSSSRFAPYRPTIRGSVDVPRSFAASQRDDVLLAWFGSRFATKKQFAGTDATAWAGGANDADTDSVEEAFAQLSSYQIGCITSHPTRH
jgi:hypothetical protein